MRTTLATMALALLSVAGCARDRCNCNCSSPCDTTAPATFKPCVINTKSAAAPPAADRKSPYVAGMPTIPSASSAAPLPAVQHWWPAVLTPIPAASPAPERSAPPAPLKTPSTTTAPVSRQLTDRPERPATELPEPAKLPARPSESVPPQPKSSEAPAETSPQALNLGQTPEPEIAPILQAGATAEPPLAQTPADAAKVLTGIVESWRRTWRLRYAAIDVEDANGGRVTLIGPNVGELQEGQHVRIRGILIPAADRGSAPTFDVQTIEVLD